MLLKDSHCKSPHQGPRRHFEIGGAKIFLGILVLIKKLEFLGRNWYLFSKSKNVGGAIAPPAPPPTGALDEITEFFLMRIFF